MPPMSDRKNFPRFRAHLRLMAHGTALISYDTLEDVRHSYKSRETRRASARWLMNQTRIVAPRNLLRRRDYPIKCFA